MKRVSSFVQSLLGGAAVAIGGIVFLSVENRALGAFLFAVGLFAICTMKLNLYTGKVCFCPTNPPAYLLHVAGVWLGNLVGTVLVALLVRATRTGTAIAPRAIEICEAKLGDSLVSIFILAVLCNIMIYIAVESYLNNPHEMGKYLGIVFGVMVFILAGFEHCVANMFYFTVAGVWGTKAALYMLVMSLGNALGGILFPLAKQLRIKAEAGNR